MRLNFVQRLMRFLFWPICAMSVVSMLRHNDLDQIINTYCARRTECFAACTNSNFPFLNCEERKSEIEYNGNTYTDFFFYPKPAMEKSIEELEHYLDCMGYIDDVSALPLPTDQSFLPELSHSLHAAGRLPPAKNPHLFPAVPHERRLLPGLQRGQAGQVHGRAVRRRGR